MKKAYAMLVRGAMAALAVCGLLGAARAQSGPYGNEWIVPGQQYYKIKVWRDGLYRIDQQYLAQAGIAGVVPSQVQLWRRGREVAIYGGGNQVSLDATTYFEFYGQRNDGKLDREYYKNPADQAHQYYSFYTDTAAYFLTWSAARPGKRMQQPAAAGGVPHAWRLQTALRVYTSTYHEDPAFGRYTFLPWLEGGEGFFSPGYGNPSVAPLANDTLFRAVPAGATTPPRIEVALVGGSSLGRDPRSQLPYHATAVSVVPPGGTARQLGVLRYVGFDHAIGRYTLQRNDFTSAGGLTLSLGVVQQTAAAPFDLYKVGYLKAVVPQSNRWFTNRRSVWFSNDTLLAGVGTFEVDSVPASVRGYDVHDPWNVQRVEPTAAQTLGPLGRRFVFPSATTAQSRKLLLADAGYALAPGPARRVVFRGINPVAPTFVIVTHPKLMKPATGPGGGAPVPNAAREYAKYRASVAGGRYDTLMVTASQLYDQFHYGERSVIALRHFALWLAAARPANGPAKYLLLLGRALEPGAPRGGDNTATYSQPAAATSRVLGERGLDLVPTSTRAVSDNFLSSDWPNGDYVPRLPTGRVPADSAQQVLDYLDKLRTHEALGPDGWRKNALHLAGPEDANETQYMQGLLDGYKNRYERPLFGGKVVRTYNRGNLGGSLSLKADLNVSSELNSGLSLINYFGHGSNTYLQLNLGVVDDPANGYNNQGRYPVMFVNGCAAARVDFDFLPNVKPLVLGLNWLFARQRGLVGFMAQTGYAYPDKLDAAQDLFHRLLFNDPNWYGRPVAEVHGEVVRQLQRVPGLSRDSAWVEQWLGTRWLGDPAFKLYAPAQPDFIASNNALSVAPAPGQAALTAASAQLVLNVGVSNPGKITTDSLEIEVVRRYPAGGGRANDRYLFKFRQSWQRDTVYAVTLPNTGDVFGENCFDVNLNYRRRVAELSFANNAASTCFTFLRGGVTTLSPPEFAIVPTRTPRLVAQNNNPNGPTRAYEFELDTAAAFNSPLVQRSTQSAAAVASWRPTLPAPPAGRADSVVWYWRVRFAQTLSPDEDGRWVTSSFRVLPNSVGGWSQSHYAQLRRNSANGVQALAPNGRWAFTEQRRPVLLRTRGGGTGGNGLTFGTTQGFGIRTDPNAPPFVNNCGIRSPNVLVAVLDEHSLRPVAVPTGGGTPYLSCGVGTQPMYHFAVDPANAADTLNNLNNSAAQRADLERLLRNVPDGAYVALVSANRLRYSNFGPGLKQALASLLGSRLVNTLNNGEPWALVAQKRAAGGRLIQEKGPDRQVTTPAPRDQVVVLNDTLRLPGQRGTVVSTRIGPARQWLNLYHAVKKPSPTGNYTLKLVGIDANNNPTVLNAAVPTSLGPGLNSFSLAAISAQQYPYLQLELALEDTTNRVPAQLKQWLVTYQGVPEGVVRRDLVPAAAYDAAALQQQAQRDGKIRFPVKFENVSTEDFRAPLQATVRLAGTSPLRTATVALNRVLKADSVATLQAEISTVGLTGSFAPEVTVNPRLQPEQNYFNNELKLAPVPVADTNLPPTLDVAFDGRHILNGEIVSAAPVVTIQLRDNDRFRRIRSASAFTVLLVRPDGATQAVNVNGPEVQFSVDSTSQAGTVARLEYRPGHSAPLPDGQYTLRAQGRDATNLAAGQQDYEVKFEVVNASTITNVFPYPNPVTSKARFVFTVTGQELPRNLKIQILTLTGRVVREIFMHELGPLHIGNNVTDYAWDGTDQYGDRLANGTYLYRVLLDDPNGQFGRRATEGDKAFKNDWGKLVLLR